MPNKNYLSGRRLEYEIVNMARKQGDQATRTAGSHGWIDIVRKHMVDGSRYTWDWESLYPGFALGQTNTEPFTLIRVGKRYIDTLYVWIARGKDGWDHATFPFTAYHLIQCKRKLNRKAKV